MKTYTLLLFTLLTITVSSCKNDDDNTPPIEQLPEATQEGLGTFGCLINGQAFVETGTFFNTFYQQVDGEFFFGITGEFEDKNPSAIAMGTNQRTIEEGETLNLKLNESGNAYARVFFSPSENNFQSAFTDEQENTGTLTITKLDFENGIVSGTFEMNMIDPFTGEVVTITEGRFDTLFTQ
ncbi:hypothetical protein [uncultured Dokdonia sp.]|uniref:hypothetical protein n=1 Tax=uncultured Dokdonia sp. TaxID=575653 RepID=UPI0026385CB7|nr:hypothetical protein [uncultured Dokdonia sp.]